MPSIQREDPSIVGSNSGARIRGVPGMEATGEQTNVLDVGIVRESSFANQV